MRQIYCDSRYIAPAVPPPMNSDAFTGAVAWTFALYIILLPFNLFTLDCRLDYFSFLASYKLIITHFSKFNSIFFNKCNCACFILFHFLNIYLRYFINDLNSRIIKKSVSLKIFRLIMKS